MRKLLVLLIVAIGAIGAATPAFAQDDKKYDVNIGGGAMFPLGSFKDSFNTGGSFNIGGTYFITPVIGIQGEYNYARMNGPAKTLGLLSPPQLIESNQQLNVGLFDVVVRSHRRDSMIGAYFLAGPGVYHRQVQLTSPAVGLTTFCDPYWYVCYPVAVPVDQILGSRGSTDFGMNFGGGITFGHEAKFYIEARYHYVWGPTINQPTATPAASGAATNVSTNASYFPLLFGVRF